MSKHVSIKPTSKPIQTYYEALQSYGAQGVEHEGALETAFQRLLADTARLKNWTLIPKLKMKVAGKLIFPDGTLRDDFNLPRGYWEAKDTHDDLDQEIGKKIGKGYPLTNTIFEDTRQAVLYQTGQEALRVDLSNPQGLCDLLSGFYAYTEPDIEGFEQAVQEFKDRVPDLAGGLNEKIKDAHKRNKKFQAAFDDFLALCQQALNPNIRRDAVDEMLVQHLLTERLIRKIFDNAEFTQRNVIAAEVEKVITALVSQSFDRDQFLKSLDRFYRAIEDAAHSIEDFNEKQHFLNTVYERFFETVARIPGYRIMPPSPCAESWWSEPGLGRAAPAAGPAPAGPRSPAASEPGTPSSASCGSDDCHAPPRWTSRPAAARPRTPGPSPTPAPAAS
jgi:hypothetical protein